MALQMDRQPVSEDDFLRPDEPEWLRKEYYGVTAPVPQDYDEYLRLNRLQDEADQARFTGLAEGLPKASWEP